MKTERPVPYMPTPLTARTQSAAVVDVPVLDVPVRRDEMVRTDRPPFTVRLTLGTTVKLVGGVTHWHVLDDGALNIYGPLPDGRVTKLRTINAVDWTEIERPTTTGADQ